MLFAFICRDAADSLQARLANRQAHLANIRELEQQNRVTLAGPFPKLAGRDPVDCGFDGSLIVADFASLEAARAWIETDPYHVHGVWEEVTILPFVAVLRGEK